jgi:pyruvate-formate lyase-activating enzyme
VEIVTLLIAGFNDSEAELTKLTEFIVSVSPEIPWHVTAFHQDYGDNRSVLLDRLGRPLRTCGCR